MFEIINFLLIRLDFGSYLSNTSYFGFLFAQACTLCFVFRLCRRLFLLRCGLRILGLCLGFLLNSLTSPTSNVLANQFNGPKIESRETINNIWVQGFRKCSNA